MFLLSCQDMDTQENKKLTPMARSELGSTGIKLNLLTNQFKVNFNKPGDITKYFTQYSVCVYTFLRKY